MVRRRPPNTEMSVVFYCIALLAGAISTVESACSSTTMPTAITFISQYEIGEEGQGVYGHFLSGASSTLSYGNYTADEAYQLNVVGVPGESAECPIDCLVKVSALYKASGADYMGMVMARPQDTSLYPGYSDIGLPPVICAVAAGQCGASKPLYLYHSLPANDYYADSEKSSNISMSATYTMELMGQPLCYMWVTNLTTTTSTTTTTTTAPSNVTTVSVPINGTTTTFPINGTTTTMPINGTTTTTAPNLGNTTTTTVAPGTNTTSSVNGTTTTTTVAPGGANSTTTTALGGNTTTTASPGGNSTTTVAPGGGGGGNSTSSTDSTHKKHWWTRWKWPIISLGVLLLAGLVTCCVAWLTCCFVGAAAGCAVAPKMASPPPSYSSPGPMLPPMPIQAGVMQPFTVGFPPPGVPY